MVSFVRIQYMYASIIQENLVSHFQRSKEISMIMRTQL